MSLPERRDSMPASRTAPSTRKDTASMNLECTLLGSGGCSALFCPPAVSQRLPRLCIPPSTRVAPTPSMPACLPVVQAASYAHRDLSTSPFTGSPRRRTRCSRATALNSSGALGYQGSAEYGLRGWDTSCYDEGYDARESRYGFIG
jgi:hypothetical protein